jgi:hypothetical protein
MTSSNTLKKLVSFGAAMLLAVGGSLVAAEPASAAVPVPMAVAGGPYFYGASWEPAFTIVLKTGAWDNGNGATVTHTWYRCNASSNTPASDSGCTSLTSTAVSAGQSTYTTQNPDIDKWIEVVVQLTNADGPSTPVVVISNSAVAALPVVTLDANGGTAGTTTSLTGRNLTLPAQFVTASGTYPTRSGCNFSGWSTTTSPANIVQNQNYAPSSSITLKAMWAGANCGPVAPLVVTPVAATPVAESAKPLPVWAAPILKQIPTLSKTLNTDGGKVSLTDGDFSSLKTVTVGGKEVAFSTDAKGNVNIPIPAGAAGTTADLVVTFTGGKMVIQDGIKYVAPTDVAKVAEAGVAGFKANSSKVSGALAASILYAAQIDHKANAIACSGYAASKAQVALATARAQAACDYATGAYSNLTKSTVAVIVNKAKAKSASVGIKVYH